MSRMAESWAAGVDGPLGLGLDLELGCLRGRIVPVPTLNRRTNLCSLVWTLTLTRCEVEELAEKEAILVQASAKADELSTQVHGA